MSSCLGQKGLQGQSSDNKMQSGAFMVPPRLLAKTTCFPSCQTIIRTNNQQTQLTPVYFKRSLLAEVLFAGTAWLPLATSAAAQQKHFLPFYRGNLLAGSGQCLEEVDTPQIWVTGLILCTKNKLGF